MALVVAGMVVSACGGAAATLASPTLPTSVQGSGNVLAPTAPITQAAPTVQPTPAPTPTPTLAPTPMPLPAAIPEVAVVKCRTIDASGGSAGTAPAKVHAQIPADLAPRLAAYVVSDGYLVIGPAGGKCSAELFGGGDAAIVIRSRADPQAVVSITSSVSFSEVLEWSCVVDRKAAALLVNELGYPCPRSPKGERVTDSGTGSARFTESRRSTGGLPHEVSKYQTRGSLKYDRGDEDRYAEVRACALPPADKDLCEAILEGRLRTADVEGWDLTNVARVESSDKVGPPWAALAIDPAGVDHIVFASATGVVSGENSSTGWKQVRTWAGFRAPQIAIGSDGIVHVVMVSTTDGATYYVSESGGASAEPQQVLGPAAASNAGPALALDGLGNVFVARVTHPTAAPGGTVGPERVMQIVVRGSTGGWSRPQRVAADGPSVALAGVPAGGARVVYSRKDRLRIAEVAADATVGNAQALVKEFGTRAYAIAIAPDGRLAIAGVTGTRVAVLQERGEKWVQSVVEDSFEPIKATGISVAFKPATQKLVVVWDHRGTDSFYQVAIGPGRANDASWQASFWLHPDGPPAAGGFDLALTANGHPHVVLPVSQDDGTVVFQMAAR